MPKLAAAAAAAAPEVRAAAAAAPDTIDHARPNGRFSDWVKTAEAWPNPFSANTLEEDKPFKHMPKKCRHAQCHLMQMYTEFGTRDLCEPCYKTMHGGSYTPSSDVAQTRKCDACIIPDRELVRRLFKGAPPNTFLTFDYVHVFPKPYDTYPWLCQPGVSAAAFIANLQADTVARPQTMQQRIERKAFLMPSSDGMRSPTDSEWEELQWEAEVAAMPPYEEVGPKFALMHDAVKDKPFKHKPKKCAHPQCHLMQMYTEFGTRDLCEPCYKTMHGGWYSPSSDVAQTGKCDACFIPDPELVRCLFNGVPPNTFLTFDYVHAFPKPYDTYPWLCQPGVSAAEAYIATLQADAAARHQTMQQPIHQPFQPEAASSSSSQPPPQPPQALPPAPQPQAPVLPHSQQLPGLIGPQPLTWRGKSGGKSRGRGRPY